MSSSVSIGSISYKFFEVFVHDENLVEISLEWIKCSFSSKLENLQFLKWRSCCQNIITAFSIIVTLVPSLPMY